MVLKSFPNFFKNVLKISCFTSKYLIKTPKNPMILKNWVTCGENSMALVGFLVALSVSAKLR